MFRFGFCPQSLSLFICRLSCPPVCSADQRQRKNWYAPRPLRLGGEN
ncbi:hypothetical protein D1AOALGA4SA_12353 [Olavius algarvensis Delta 1 endosymbiont]|nr:hypothetical protein D1AOALGA4SA_12353 [Olavius algarvensis Delta 1 endosymbiont]